MSCSKIMDMVYEYSENGHKQGLLGNEMPLLNQIQVALHAFTCSNCTREIERYKEARDILREDFFPLSPNLEDSILAKIGIEDEAEIENSFAMPGSLSIRGWIIAGVIIMISLVTAFFGLDFQNLASESGTSFLLPMGITIGIVLTVYGALFIGSNLKELSERFGL